MTEDDVEADEISVALEAPIEDVRIDCAPSLLVFLRFPWLARFPPLHPSVLIAAVIGRKGFAPGPLSSIFISTSTWLL